MQPALLDQVAEFQAVGQAADQGEPLVQEEPLQGLGHAEEVVPASLPAGKERRRLRAAFPAAPFLALLGQLANVGNWSSKVRPRSAAAEGQCRRSVTKE